MRRHKMSKGKSKRMFRKTANRTHRRNVQGAQIMRGGIRL